MNVFLRSARTDITFPEKERTRITFLPIVRLAENIVIANYTNSIDMTRMLVWSLCLMTILFATSDLGVCGVRELRTFVSRIHVRVHLDCVYQHDDKTRL